MSSILERYFTSHTNNITSLNSLDNINSFLSNSNHNSRNFKYKEVTNSRGSWNKILKHRNIDDYRTSLNTKYDKDKLKETDYNTSNITKRNFNYGQLVLPFISTKRPINDKYKVEKTEEFYKEVDEIVDNLLKSKKIPNKNDNEETENEEKKFTIEINENDFNMDYIKENIKYFPKNLDYAKSLKLQIQCLGNAKNRELLINSINDYYSKTPQCSNELKKINYRTQRHKTDNEAEVFNYGNKNPLFKSNFTKVDRIKLNKLMKFQAENNIGTNQNIDERIGFLLNETKKTQKLLKDRSKINKSKMANIINLYNKNKITI